MSSPTTRDHRGVERPARGATVVNDVAMPMTFQTRAYRKQPASTGPCRCQPHDPLGAALTRPGGQHTAVAPPTAGNAPRRGKGVLTSMEPPPTITSAHGDGAEGT